MLLSKMSQNEEFLIKIGDYWIVEEDMGEVIRRLKEINTGIYTEEEKTQETEKLLKEYDYCK